MATSAILIIDGILESLGLLESCDTDVLLPLDLVGSSDEAACTEEISMQFRRSKSAIR